MEMLFEYIDELNVPYEAFYAGEAGYFPVPSHWHYYMEAIHMTKGEMLAVCGANTYRLKAGDLLLCFPHVIHAYRYADSHKPHYRVVKFDVHAFQSDHARFAQLVNTFLAAGRDPNAPVVFTQDELTAYPIATLFDTCIREVAENRLGYAMLAHAQLCSLLVYVERIWKEKGYQPDEERIREDTMPIQSISEYIDKHSSEHITVQELADICHLSYAYFSRAFKNYYGRSCRDYIEYVRVCKAEYLLLFSSCDLNYISEETGFSDCSHFIKTFKKYKGITPKQYRLHRELY